VVLSKVGLGRGDLAHMRLMEVRQTCFVDVVLPSFDASIQSYSRFTILVRLALKIRLKGNAELLISRQGYPLQCVGLDDSLLYSGALPGLGL
jgi:hypothetical protein